MSLSEVFYEAACRMSDTPRSRYYHFGNHYEYSCHAISMVCGYGLDYLHCPEADEYRDLMQFHSSEESFIGGTEKVLAAAHAVGWHEQDFRTFMLLMASEAVK